MSETDLSKIWLHRNSDDYAVGTQLKSISPFAACENGVVKAENSPPGYDSAFLTSISRGQDGWGKWGFEIASGFPAVGEGGELWFRVAAYFPTGYVFPSHHGSFKTFRIGRKKSDGANGGYLDWQIRDDRDWQSNIEMSDDEGWVKHSGGRVSAGEWAIFEVYSKLHPTSGIMRIWKNGYLFGERTGLDTLRSGNRTSRVLWLTYVNGGAPASQSMSFAEVAIAAQGGGRNDAQHLGMDGSGNRFIGTALSIGGSPVEPPTEPPVEPPVEPPIDPPDPPGAIEARLQYAGTNVVVRENRVNITSDKPVHIIEP